MKTPTALTKLQIEELICRKLYPDCSIQYLNDVIFRHPKSRKAWKDASYVQELVDEWEECERENIIRGVAVELDGFQLDAVLTHFGEYVRGRIYNNRTQMNRGWERFKDTVGYRIALKVFWSWAHWQEDKIEKDPDGNI